MALPAFTQHRGLRRRIPCRTDVSDHVTPKTVCENEKVVGRLLYVKRGADFRGGAVEHINVSEFANTIEILMQSSYRVSEFARCINQGTVGANVKIPVPISVLPFSGLNTTFSDDPHMMGRVGVTFCTETRAVPRLWFDEEAMKGDRVGTWEGTRSRS